MEGPGPFRLRLNEPAIRQRVTPGTVRRVLHYIRRFRRALAVLMVLTAFDAAVTAAGPLILKVVVDDGIAPRRTGVVLAWSLIAAGLAVADALATYAQAWLSGRVGQGVIYDLRTTVFEHVQKQPLAFFARAQTGSMVSRLTSDVIGAQQAVSSLLSQATSTLLTVVLVLATMFFLSWQITLAALAAIPFFLIPARLIARRLQRLSRQMMRLDAEIGSLMTERFNVAGAMLAKLYGRPEAEAEMFASRAARVRDIFVVTSVFSRMFPIILTLLAALTTAVVYGLGGTLAIHGSFQVGTLVAMAALLTRLYSPINQLSTLQSGVMTALVSFDRIFEILDLAPLINERPDAVPLAGPAAPGGIGVPVAHAPEVEFDHVSFRYPAAREVSLASLESIAKAEPERSRDATTLNDLSFRLPAGQLTALVGPSGAGKTTITHLVPRLYDVTSGSVRIDGVDVRDLTLASLRDAVGVVPQDTHLFHDTLRANLLYARPDAAEAEIVEACEAARIWHVISALPDGLDTVAGDRGYRLSGGERQRVALARLLLKSPPIVVLDEATAHLDSESEAAIQRALATALAGRTSLVIAHRLSTVRDADQILVVEAGRIRECGRHEELLAAGGLYSDLYRTQFMGQETGMNGARPR